jgi:hypothetical protein
VLPIGLLTAVLLLALAARSTAEAGVARCAAAGGCVAGGDRGCLGVGGRHGSGGVDGRGGGGDLLVLVLVLVLPLLLLGDGRWTRAGCEVCIRVVHDARGWLSWASRDIGDRDRRRGERRRHPLACSQLAGGRVETGKVKRRLFLLEGSVGRRGRPGARRRVGDAPRATVGAGLGLRGIQGRRRRRACRRRRESWCVCGGRRMGGLRLLLMVMVVVVRRVCRGWMRRV